MKPSANSNQMTLCWHCEEAVHRYATHCPYCQKSLMPSQMTSQPVAKEPLSPTGKIAAIHSQENPFASIIDEQFQTPTAEELPSFVSQAFFVLLSLASLLAGSFFFFFGILIKLFSHDGVFTLEWNISSWPYFVFSAIILVIVGLATLSKVEK